MLKQLAQRLHNATTEEELMAIVQEASVDLIAHSRIIDMMTMAQLQTVSAALLAATTDHLQIGGEFAKFITNYVPVQIALQRAIAKTDTSVPNEGIRRHLMEQFDD
ncbi:MAG: hypothetical protein K2Y39_06030 [Candidatus Obscuribacterales bacterium]|nr:hypothetical protein [Candidatus Obscuribacterales bacterium]